MSLNQPVWLSELVGGQEKDGITPEISKEGTSPSDPMVSLIALMARRRFFESGSWR